MRIKQIHPAFIMPTKGSSNAAGWDLYMPEDGWVGSTPAAIKLGFSTAIPENHVGLILPRSSAGSNGLRLANTMGVIDSDYRGEWIAKIQCDPAKGTYQWKAGERILQLVILPVSRHELMLVEDLDDTDRGAGGFGSSGL